MSPLLKKLRYAPGMKISVIGAPAGFEGELAKARDLVRAGPRDKDVDVVQAFYTRLAEVKKSVPKLKSKLGEKSILWICYPKGKALNTDLNRDILRESLEPLGLEAVALVAIDEVWSALRFKIARS